MNDELSINLTELLGITFMENFYTNLIFNYNTHTHTHTQKKLFHHAINQSKRNQAETSKGSLWRKIDKELSPGEARPMSKGCNVLLTWLKHGFLKRYSSWIINKKKKERKKKITISIPRSTHKFFLEWKER